VDRNNQTFTPSPILRPREQVERQIREAIFSNVFSRGDKLPSEMELASRFGVSRATVREALRALASEGLINKVPGAGGGSFVEMFDYESLGSWLSNSMSNILRLGQISYGEVMHVRRMLELPSARLAAEHRTDDDLAQLHAIMKSEGDITVDDPRVPVLDVGFHAALAGATRNPLLSSFVCALHNVTQPVSRIVLSPEAGRTTVRQHIAIADAVERSDPDAAEAAMRDHLDYIATLREHEWPTQSVQLR
jgi:GntR family transcriptional regulator, transcriptional repressor for pyruvate dehydrogenase complex